MKYIKDRHLVRDLMVKISYKNQSIQSKQKEIHVKTYCKVASTNTSFLEPHLGIYRLPIRGKKIGHFCGKIDFIISNMC